jgi:hypothetical protein
MNPYPSIQETMEHMPTIAGYWQEAGHPWNPTILQRMDADKKRLTETEIPYIGEEDTEDEEQEEPEEEEQMTHGWTL